jgi:hypothetical protein
MFVIIAGGIVAWDPVCTGRMGHVAGTEACGDYQRKNAQLDGAEKVLFGSVRFHLAVNGGLTFGYRGVAERLTGGDRAANGGRPSSDRAATGQRPGGDRAATRREKVTRV